MDKAKAKVGEFLHKSGKHDTTVHESVAPAVTHETVKPQQHEHNTTAVDREVHQDHHHTSVQPVHDRNVLPEQHHVQEGQTQTRDHRHGQDHSIKDKLQQQAAQFTDKRTTADTTRTQQNEPVLTGEHQHHHVHETIQPVVQRETIEPHVVHSVNKIHEKHDKPAQVHEGSTLPAMNMSDFRGQGGSLTGREERIDSFPGEPHNISGHSGGAHGAGTTAGTHGLTGNQQSVGTGSHGTGVGAGSRGVGTSTGSGLPGTHGTGAGSGLTGNHGTGTGSGLPGTHGTGTHGTGAGAGIPGTGSRQRRSSSLSSSDLEGSGKTKTKTGKPSLMDKINPKVDATGDGKAGFMK